jgi:hypothetical protein
LRVVNDVKEHLYSAACSKRWVDRWERGGHVRVVSDV